MKNKPFFITFSTISIYEATHTYAQNKTSISNISTFTSLFMA